MAEIKVLIEGYVREKNGAELASSTVAFIKDSDQNIIVDPGLDRLLLLKALADNDLNPEAINYVILTHAHPDHSLLAGIFSQAKIVDHEAIHSWDGKIIKHDGSIPGLGLKIISTAGHSPEHVSVLLNTEKFGKVVIAGDVIWWSDNEEQKTDLASLLARADSYATDETALKASRKKILALADYIIPGHGRMFKNKKI